MQAEQRGQRAFAAQRQQNVERRRGACGQADATGQLTENRMVEHGVYRQLASQAMTDLGGQSNRQQGVASQVEEVIGEADALQAEQPRDKLAEQDFLRCRRGDESGDDTTVLDSE